jgi:hypothetical protein
MQDDVKPQGAVFVLTVIVPSFEFVFELGLLVTVQ